MPTNDTTSGTRRSAALLGIALALLIVAAVVTTLAARSRWWLPPLASAQGRSIDQLFIATFGIISVAFVLVHGLLALFVWLYRDRGQRASYWHENRALELTYTIIPAIVMAGLTLSAAGLWSRIHSAPPPQALVVEGRGEQFGWEARDPGPDGKFGRGGAGGPLARGGAGSGAGPTPATTTPGRIRGRWTPRIRRPRTTWCWTSAPQANCTWWWTAPRRSASAPRMCCPPSSSPPSASSRTPYPGWSRASGSRRRRRGRTRSPAPTCAGACPTSCGASSWSRRRRNTTPGWPRPGPESSANTESVHEADA